MVGRSNKDQWIGVIGIYLETGMVHNVAGYPEIPLPFQHTCHHPLTIGKVQGQRDARIALGKGGQIGRQEVGPRRRRGPYP
jgi:hypothetical protein